MVSKVISFSTIIKFRSKNYSSFGCQSVKMDEYNAQNDFTHHKSNKGKNKFMHRGFVYRINRSVDQTVFWLCEQNLYHCNGRITMIVFIHFGTYAFWFYVFCQLYIVDLYVMDFYVLKLYLLSCTDPSATDSAQEFYSPKMPQLR